MILDKLKNKIRIHYWSVLWSVIQALDLPGPRKVIFFLLLGGVFFGILELIGILIVFPILKAIVDFQDLLDQNRYLYSILSHLPFSPQSSLIFLLCCLMMCIIFIKNAYIIFFSWIQEHLLCSWKVIISEKLMSYYLNLPFEMVLIRGVTEPSLMVADYSSAVCNQFVLSALNLISNILVVLVVASFFVWMHPILISFALLWFFCAIVFMYRLLTQKIKKLSDANAESIKKRFYRMQYIFNHAREIRVFQKQDFFYHRFYEQTVDFMRSDSRLILLKQIPMPMLEVFLVLGMLIAVLSTMYHHLNDISYVLGTMAALTLIFMRIGPIFNRIQVSAHDLDSSYPITEKVLHELFLARQLEKSNTRQIEESACVSFCKSITYQNVTFSYRARPDVAVLKNVNVTLDRGKKYGIVGHSGSGKTTFVDLFLGLLSPTSGTILIDNHPVALMNYSSWQRLLSFVPQKVDVSDGTFLENVAFGEDPDTVNVERIFHALEQAQLIDLVQQLPQNIYSPVGNISGGQKQRIGLARALYYKKEIIVLDEPTAALDVLTEAAIMKTIMGLSEKTVLIIAHRLSTLKSCDHLLYFYDGVLQGEGSFKDLSERFLSFNEMIKLSSF